MRKFNSGSTKSVPDRFSGFHHIQWIQNPNPRNNKKIDILNKINLFNVSKCSDRFINFIRFPRRYDYFPGSFSFNCFNFFTFFPLINIFLQCSDFFNILPDFFLFFNILLKFFNQKTLFSKGIMLIGKDGTT